MSSGHFLSTSPLANHSTMDPFSRLSCMVVFAFVMTATSAVSGQDVVELPAPSDHFLSDGDTSDSVTRASELPFIGYEPAICDGGCGTGCCGPVDCGDCCCASPWLLTGYADGTYYDIPGESRSGGRYGLQAALQLWPNLTLVGEADANHIGGGTQYVGRVGLLRVGNPCGCGLIDPLTIDVSFGNYTDTRIDGFYLNEIYARLGRAIAPGLEVGLIYADGLNTDNDVPVFVTNVGVTRLGFFTMGRELELYFAAQGPAVDWGMTCAFPEGNRDFRVGAFASLPVSSRVSMVANVDYETGFGDWFATYGLEFRFGGSSSCCPSVEQVVVRGQNPDLLPPEYRTLPPEVLTRRERVDELSLSGFFYDLFRREPETSARSRALAIHRRTVRQGFPFGILSVGLNDDFAAMQDNNVIVNTGIRVNPR